MTRHRHYERPGDADAIADLRTILARAHANLDLRDRCRAEGRPWPTPNDRLLVISTTRELQRRLIVRRPAHG